MFQFTRPRGARHPPCGRGSPRPRFNSRAHAGRDGGGAYVYGGSLFQFTRPRGARRGMRPTPRATGGCFNSRAHAGRDTAVAGYYLLGRGFNSRAHAGRDTPRNPPRTRRRFQFTRPRGARRQKRASRTPRNCFNSRAHAGRDKDMAGAAVFGDVSIHAPTRGATGRSRGARVPEPVSIHAPTRGATSAR